MLGKGGLANVNKSHSIRHITPKSRESSVMEIENVGNGQHDLQMVNRLNESRSPYVSPYGGSDDETVRAKSPPA